MAHKALAFKEEGNVYFQNGDFQAAENCYTQAYVPTLFQLYQDAANASNSILKDPSNPKLFTNRAMTRIKLEAWDACMNDSINAIELDSKSLKAYYYLAQAQLALKRPNEAFCSAMTAYNRCVETHDKSIPNVSALVLGAKKQKWLAKERERNRNRSSLLRELEDSLLKNKEAELQELRHRKLDSVEEKEERADIERAHELKVEELHSTFALADPKNMPKREVPDYLIDSITFSVMHDPVTTKTGNSYDRSTLIEHFRRSLTDPLTREPLQMHDLRPNLALKQACLEFLDENGWAVDW
ncbi:MAG: hypothetical protein Q9217_005780 [Psora testacea]